MYLLLILSAFLSLSLQASKELFSNPNPQMIIEPPAAISLQPLTINQPQQEAPIILATQQPASTSSISASSLASCLCKKSCAALGLLLCIQCPEHDSVCKRTCFDKANTQTMNECVFPNCMLYQICTRTLGNLCYSVLAVVPTILQHYCLQPLCCISPCHREEIYMHYGCVCWGCCENRRDLNSNYISEWCGCRDCSGCCCCLDTLYIHCRSRHACGTFIDHHFKTISKNPENTRCCLISCGKDTEILTCNHPYCIGCTCGGCPVQTTEYR